MCDIYIPGTVKERAYIQSKSTIARRDMKDETLDKLASKDPVFDIDFALPKLAFTALATPGRPQRFTKKLINWSYLLSDNDNKEEDPLNNDPDFAFVWDI